MAKVMRRMLLLAHTVGFALLFVCWAEGTEAAADTGADAMTHAFRGAKPTGKGVYSVASSGQKKKSTGEILETLGDDEIIIDIGGDDKLKWGLLRKHVEALGIGIDRPDMQPEGNAELKKITFQSRCKKLLKEYIEYGVFAREAKKMGIKVDEAQFKEYRAKAREAYANKGESGKAILKLLDSGESFYERNLTNALYCLAYKRQVMAPVSGTDDVEINKMIGLRHAANEAAVATNLINKAFISKILGELRSGMDFGDAADKWSEGDGSGTRGVLMDGMDEHVERFGEDDLPKEVWDALKPLKEGEISGVVETPYAWYILRLLKRYPATEDTGVTVEFAQIVIEKRFIEPELSAEQSRQHIIQLKLRVQMQAKLQELMKTTPIISKIPLAPPKGGKGKGTRIRRIK